MLPDMYCREELMIVVVVVSLYSIWRRMAFTKRDYYECLVDLLGLR